MDDTDNKKDFPIEGGGTPEGVASWKSPIRQEPAPLSDPSENLTPPVSVLKSEFVDGKKLNYYETGRQDAEFTVLNLSGLGAGSGEGNLRLDHALNGFVENSRGMQTLRTDLPKAAAKIEELMGEFQGDYRTITPQLSGMGWSEALDNPTLDNQADFYAEFIRKKGFENVILFGSSMGGNLATRIASRHPDIAIGLALQGVMGKADDLRKQDVLLARAVTATPARLFIENFPGASWIMKQVLRRGTKGQVDFRLADEQGKEQMFKDSDKAEPRTYLLSLKGILEDLTPEIEKIKIPVVLLDGGKAEVVSFDKTKELAGRFAPEIVGDDDRESLQKKIDEGKVLIYKVGGVVGKHAHTVLNTAPEVMAVMFNHAVKKYFKLGRNNPAPADKAA